MAETLHIDQSTKGKRLSLSAVIFALVAVILVFAKFNNEGFQILWRYFLPGPTRPCPCRSPSWPSRSGCLRTAGKVCLDAHDPRRLLPLHLLHLHRQRQDRLQHPLTYAYIIGVVAAVLYVGVIIWYGRKRTNAHTPALIEASI